MNEWSFEAGYVRRDYGIRSTKYQSDPAASGTLRYGVNNTLTAQIHGEAARGYSGGHCRQHRIGFARTTQS